MQALAGQKLEALRVQQEATPAAVAAAPAPQPALAPTLAPASPTPAASLQQLLAAFNVDNLSPADKQQLEATTTQLGLAGGAARQLLDTLAVLAANSLAAHRQQPESEEACQYAGTAEQLTAWQQELARSGQPLPAEAVPVPAGTPMEAEDERAPPVKRPAESSAASVVDVEADRVDYRYDYDIPDEDAEQEATDHLIGTDDEKAAAAPAPKASKTGKKGKKEVAFPSDGKTAQESAMDIAAELQQKLSSESAEVVVSDVASGATSSSQSMG